MTSASQRGKGIPMKRMPYPCPVCGAILTDAFDRVMAMAAEEERDPDAYRADLVKRLREHGMTGHADRLEASPDWASTEERYDSLIAHLRALVAAGEVGDWRHAIQGLLPEGFDDDQ